MTEQENQAELNAEHVGTDISASSEFQPMLVHGPEENTSSVVVQSVPVTITWVPLSEVESLMSITHLSQFLTTFGTVLAGVGPFFSVAAGPSLNVMLLFDSIFVSLGVLMIGLGLVLHKEHVTDVIVRWREKASGRGMGATMVSHTAQPFGSIQGVDLRKNTPSSEGRS